MPTVQVTVRELKDIDPTRFDKEYGEWRVYMPYDDWWEDSYADFKATCSELLIRVDDITFSGFWSQGDGAAFAGRVDLTAFMERSGLEVEYPALYIGVKNDGSYIRVAFRDNNMRCAAYEAYANQTAPDGIFSGLDQETWEKLVDTQDRDANLEQRVLKECESLAVGLYRSLEKEYDHLTSEESFIESCEINEVTFVIEGDEE